jgi:hypothetical protein
MRVRNLVLVIVFLAGSAFAAPDYRPIYKALVGFFEMMDNLTAEIPKIHDAAGAARAVDSFATATDAFADSLEDYARKNPELARSADAPEEIQDVMKKFAKSKDLYPKLGVDLGHSVKPFADDPAVRTAVGRFQLALARVNKLSGEH